MELRRSGTILLIEDSEDDIAIIRLAFEQGVITNPMVVARDGEEAIAYLNGAGIAHEHDRPVPALVLLDLRLPRVDGFQVLRWIRQQPRFATMPVVVITVSSAVQDLNLAYQCGANSFMVKPADFQDVVRMTKTLATYWLSETTAPDTAWRPSITRLNHLPGSPSN